jgi:hypothetical protein
MEAAVVLAAGVAVALSLAGALQESKGRAIKAKNAFMAEVFVFQRV